MRLKKLMLAAVAVSMTASPVLAADVSVPAAARASEQAGESELGGGFLVAAIAAAAVIAGIIIIADGDDKPNSP